MPVTALFGVSPVVVEVRPRISALEDEVVLSSRGFEACWPFLTTSGPPLGFCATQMEGRQRTIAAAFTEHKTGCRREVESVPASARSRRGRLWSVGCTRV